MKAREVKRARATGPLSTDSPRTRVPAVSTTVAPSPDVPKAICVFSASAVFSSARWPARVLSPAFARHPGKRIHLT